MDYEDYICGNDYIYDFESDLFSDITDTESWDIDENEWDVYGDWVYEGEYTDTYDNMY